VIEELTGVKTEAEICREHQLRAPVLSRGKAEFLKRVPEILATEPSRGNEQQRIAELERVVGRLTMEVWLRNGRPTATAESPNSCIAKGGTSTRNESIV